MNEIDSLKKELESYNSRIETANAEIDDLDRRRRELVVIGTRLEGIAAYLADKVRILEGAAAAALKAAEAALVENPSGGATADSAPAETAAPRS